MSLFIGFEKRDGKNSYLVLWKPYEYDFRFQVGGHFGVACGIVNIFVVASQFTPKDAVDGFLLSFQGLLHCFFLKLTMLVGSFSL